MSYMVCVGCRKALRLGHHKRCCYFHEVSEPFAIVHGPKCLAVAPQYGGRLGPFRGDATAPEHQPWCSGAAYAADCISDWLGALNRVALPDALLVFGTLHHVHVDVDEDGGACAKDAAVGADQLALMARATSEAICPGVHVELMAVPGNALPAREAEMNCAGDVAAWVLVPGIEESCANSERPWIAVRADTAGFRALESTAYRPQVSRGTSCRDRVFVARRRGTSEMERQASSAWHVVSLSDHGISAPTSNAVSLGGLPPEILQRVAAFMGSKAVARFARCGRRMKVSVGSPWSLAERLFASTMPYVVGSARAVRAEYLVFPVEHDYCDLYADGGSGGLLRAEVLRGRDRLVAYAAERAFGPGSVHVRRCHRMWYEADAQDRMVSSGLTTQHGDEQDSTVACIADTQVLLPFQAAFAKRHGGTADETSAAAPLVLNPPGGVAPVVPVKYRGPEQSPGDPVAVVGPFDIGHIVPNISMGIGPIAQLVTPLSRYRFDNALQLAGKVPGGESRFLSARMRESETGFAIRKPAYGAYAPRVLAIVSVSSAIFVRVTPPQEGPRPPVDAD